MRLIGSKILHLISSSPLSRKIGSKREEQRAFFT
jgi:hypothetical protein